MLVGEHNSKLADKNRTALPKKFRSELSKQLVITRGYENCLLVLDTPKFEILLKKIESKPFLNRSVRDTKRYIAGGAIETTYDNQGRILIPENLKEFAEIETELVFVGVVDWIEVWSKKNWELKLAKLKNSASEIADRLGEI